MRYACAGVSATLFQEIIMHSIDTLNMKSKAMDGASMLTLQIIKQEGFFSLYKGIQPVLYGYIGSSFIYFMMYAKMKLKMQNDMKSENPQEKITSTALFYKTMIVSFVSSMFAELVSLVFYYPFDLIKTRMQVDQN